jgi:signal transduction histidine kinase
MHPTAAPRCARTGATRVASSGRQAGRPRLGEARYLSRVETPSDVPLLIAALEATGVRALVLDGRGELRHVTPAARRALGLAADALPTLALIGRFAEERGLQRRVEELPGGFKVEMLEVRGRQREVLAIALHDLRSPIANVRSYAGLLTRGNVTPEKLARLADVIARNADRALRLTSDYIESELAELGDLGVHREEHRLLPLVASAVASRRILAQERGVQLVLAPHPEVRLRLDAERFSHALEAVLDQAVARSPDGDRVRVALEVLPAQVNVDVFDSGTGPASGELDRVRDARICADRRLTPAIALTVARAILESHHGTLVVSPAHPGARWRLGLPRA